MGDLDSMEDHNTICQIINESEKKSVGAERETYWYHTGGSTWMNELHVTQDHISKR